MSKPIAVVYVNPYDSPNHSGDKFWEFARSLVEQYEKDKPDYHWFFLPSRMDFENPPPPFEFKVFYEKDFTEIKYAELKQLIEDSLKK